MTAEPENASPAAFEALAVELAGGAAARVAARRPGAASVSTKSTLTDLVTEVDREIERWLVTGILARRPDDSVVGEEGAGQEGGSGVRWVLDPIDGTVNFVLGLPQYAVSVAAERDGVVIAGAVANPVTGELFHASLGGGARLDGQSLHGPRGVEPARSVVGTGFGYAAERRARQAAVVAALLPRVADIRRMGSASLDLCAVASGRLDAYFEVGLNHWDYAAGLLIAQEAGCRASGLHGREPSPVMVAVAAAQPAPDFFALLEELGADLGAELPADG